LCKTQEDLKAFVQNLRSLIEVDHVAYHAITRNKDPYVIVTYSNEWADYYLGEELHRIDPVVQNAFRRFHPYDWKSLPWDTKPARTLLVDAVAGGVGDQGVSIPIRGPSGELALFSINHKASDAVWLQFCETHMQILLLAAHYLHQKAREIEQGDSKQSVPTLSPRELDALTYLGAGKSRAQAAEQLNISEHTLRVYIESARYKLGAANTVSAVARAAALGVIAI
jgi:DNA-binding CsgD family transcriptional regulator